MTQRPIRPVGRTKVGAGLCALLGTVLVMGATGPGTATAAEGEESWFQFAADGIRVLFPSKPLTRQETTHTAVGKIVDHEHIVHTQHGTYTVDVSKLPRAALFFAGESVVYDNAKGGILRESLGRPLAFEDVTRDGHKGKDLRYETPAAGDHPGMVGRAEMYLLDDGLYVFSVKTLKGGEDRSTRFFESIELTN